METQMSWVQIVVLLFGNAAWVMPLWLWNRTESRADQRQMLAIVQSIQQEMKDFHGRLERQDAEFKGKLALQDAEFKGTLALQDAEFKAHMMHHHRE
jgi:hypothetical protein